MIFTVCQEAGHICPHYVATPTICCGSGVWAPKRDTKFRIREVGIIGL